MPNPAPLKPGIYYHIFNRGNNREDIFREERNYDYFLKLYARHIVPFADTYAYCLLRNHFHLLVRIKSSKERDVWLRNHGLATQAGLTDVMLNPSQGFSNLFNAYTKAINKEYGRMGALFQRPFGRIEINSPSYFSRLVVYIHQNPPKHGFVEDFRSWRYSSYHALTSLKPTLLKRDGVMEWFEGLANYNFLHQRLAEDEGILRFLPDDFFF